MTQRNVLSISLKILGVISVMRAVIYIPSIGMAIPMVIAASQRQSSVWQGEYWYLGTTIAAPILLLIMAYILLKQGDSIARKLIRVDSEITVLDKWEKTAFTLALRVFGVVCLTRFISSLSSLFQRVGFQRKIINLYTLAGIISALLFLIIGVYLISGGRHLVNLAFRERKTPSQ